MLLDGRVMDVLSVSEERAVLLRCCAGHRLTAPPASQEMPWNPIELAYRRRLL